MRTKTTLDQWLVLKTVIEQGGFAQAAEFLHRSQSTVSYAISQLQSQLGVKILQIEGRRATLTPIGKVLFHRATILLDSVNTIEKIAQDTQKDWPAEISIVIDDPFPRIVLANALKEFTNLSQTRVQLHEASLSGVIEALDQEYADIVTAFTTPKGYMEFCQAQIVQVAVAHINHPLHHLPFTPTIEDLKSYIQLVVRDSAKSTTVDRGFLEAPQRWTVASSQLAVSLLQQGIGFAWVPLHYLTNTTNLKPLTLEAGQTRRFFQNLLFGKKTPPNKAALAFSECIKTALNEYHLELELKLNNFLSKFK